MHPYKVEFVQHLGIRVSIHRLEFIAWFSTQFHNDPLIFNHILWTDESKCTNNNIMNERNHRYWDLNDINPHWSSDTDFQTVWGMNICLGLLTESL